jgi:YwiC-like protein
LDRVRAEVRPDAASWRVVAVPAEHGGWGLLVEPLVLGLLLAPSPGGAAIAVAAAAGFLLHHPVKLALMDARRRTVYPRTRLALGIGSLYLAVAVAALAAAWTRSPPACAIPLAAALPFAGLQLAREVTGRGRQLLPELLGAFALAATAPAVILAAGGDAPAAVLVWAVLAARAGGSILYIRTRLRRDRGLGGSPVPALAVHAATVAVTGVLAGLGHVPWAVCGAFTILLVRAGWGLSDWHRAARPRTVGLQELAYGAATTALVAGGFLFG